MELKNKADIIDFIEKLNIKFAHKYSIIDKENSLKQYLITVEETANNRIPIIEFTDDGTFYTIDKLELNKENIKVFYNSAGEKLHTDLIIDINANENYFELLDFINSFK